MLGAKRGQQAREFARQQRPWLLRRAMKMCRSESDAEDLVQETLLRFIQAYSEAEVLPSERICASWLVRTLKNVLIDQCRRQKVQAHAAKDPNLGSELLPKQDASSRTVYDGLTDEQLQQAFDTLTPKMRTALQMQVEGKKYRDIARALDLKVGAVGKRLSDARTKLREFLQQFIHPGVH